MTAVRTLSVVLAGALLAACNVTETLRDATSIDYKSATKNQRLDIPPDLVTPRGDDRFAIPDRAGSGTTYSDYVRERGVEQKRAATVAGVLPQPDGVRIERQGNQRWLVVDQPPEKVWSVIREFWGESGFALRVESPETGIMETDWAEKRPTVPDSWLRNQLARVLGSLYVVAERDKFRTRLESDGKGTEVFVSHRGLVEEYTGALKESTVWVSRPSDPELEAEFLRRLMLRFSPAKQASAAPASAAAAPTAPAPSAAPAPERVTLVEEADGRQFLAMKEGFDRSWRQVGVALDRSGFTVEDRDRSKGVFFVRYVDPEQEARATGVFGRVFGTGKTKDLTGKRYRIELQGAPQGGTRVGVIADDGAPPANDVERRNITRIVALLREQLR